MDNVAKLAYGMSLAGMAESMMLRGSKPEVSIGLMWFSVLTSTVATMNQAMKETQPRRRRWEPKLLPEEKAF
ncbi:MAG: hypothetical protein M0R06_13075 [Sphaerochaeta sp.]|jgi:hypothetical protein|nr:hypothetical protein [Sphaerochaeta sp.]MDD2730600.1 hypothetical protein [Candidatus Portnoybacteria bacterium]